MSDEWMDDYAKWQKWSYEQQFGRGSWDKDHGVIDSNDKSPVGFAAYEPEIKRYWDDEKAVGIIERDRKYFGVACLIAKEDVERESFVRRFGLSFEKDVQWHAVSSLLDHLARSPMFKAVLVTTSKIPFKLELDIPKKLEGRTNWADTLKLDLDQQKASGVLGGPSPIYLLRQMKEEQDHARHFLDAAKRLESQAK